MNQREPDWNPMAYPARCLAYGAQNISRWEYQIDPESQSDTVKRERGQAAKPEIEKILKIMEDTGYCPSAIALVQIILGTAIVDPDEFMERADDLLAVIFGE